MSGCAFSISSSSTTLYGCVRTASTSRPPCSKPTYPGGAPISRATACFSMYSLMSKRMNSLPSSIASCLASSVLPTPVGPVNRNAPAGRSGSAEPGARSLDRLRHQVHRFVLAEHHPLERLLQRPQPLAIGRRRLARGNPRHPGDDGFDVAGVDDDSRVSGSGSGWVSALQPQGSACLAASAEAWVLGARAGLPACRRRVDRARLVDHVDRAVRQPVVAQVAGRQLGGGLERGVGVAARRDVPRSGRAGRRGSAPSLRSSALRSRSSAAGARARGPSRCACTPRTSSIR